MKRYLYRTIYVFLFISGTVQANIPINKGKIIGLVGISGIGKSTMSKGIAKTCSIACVLEPEEPFWPEIIQEHGKYNPFDILMAFRQMWLLSYSKATDLRSAGKTCILDTLYIKILHYELGKPGIQWLFPSTNPYSDSLTSLTKTDVELIPDPDYIILMECSFEDWNQLLASRGRKFDQNPEFKASFEDSKKLIESAVIQLATDRNIPLLRFNVMFGDIETQIQRFKIFLQKHHLLEDSYYYD